jgi:hypothetical protein
MTKLWNFIHLYEGKIRDLQADSGLWAVGRATSISTAHDVLV